MRSSTVFIQSRHDGAKDLYMVPNCSPGHDASIGMQRDLPGSNFQVDLYMVLSAILFVMTSGDLKIDLI